MKKFNSNVLYKICTFCIALAGLITTSDISLGLWGEPEYPTK